MVAPTNDKNTIVGVGFQDDPLSLTSGSAGRLEAVPYIEAVCKTRFDQY